MVCCAQRLLAFVVRTWQLAAHLEGASSLLQGQTRRDSQERYSRDEEANFISSALCRESSNDESSSALRYRGMQNGVQPDLGKVGASNWGRYFASTNNLLVRIVSFE